MLNVHELESRWRKYKIKAYLPIGIISISVVAIFIGISAINNSNPVDYKPKQIIKNENIKIEEKSILKKETIVHAPTIVELQKTVKPQKTVEKKNILQPSLNFMQDMQHDAVSYYKNDAIPASIVKKTKVIKPKSKKIVKIKEEVIEVEEPKVEEVKNSSIKINRQNTHEDISHVIKRFQKNNNPTLSLFVAKKYYELGEYKDAHNYALITNEINGNIEASWIIFVKSLVKLNKKDKAIKTLNKYIQYSHSNQAKILLEEIISGKFK